MTERTTEKISYSLLIPWCLLPVVMLLYCTLVAITDVPFVALGYTEYDFIVPWYSPQVNAYLLLFIAVGCITLLFTLVSLVVHRKRLFSLDHIKSHPWMLLFFFLLIWMILSTLFADDPVRAFTGSTYHYNGMGAYIIFAGVFICASFVREEKHRRCLLRLFCSVITFLSVLIIIQVYFETKLDSILMPDYSSVFNQHNHFGYVLCMTIIGLVALFLFDETAEKTTKALYLFGLGIDVLALLLNSTFGAYLASLLALPVIYGFYIRSGRRFKLTALLPVMVFISISALDCYCLLPTEATIIQKILYFCGDVNAIASGSEEAIHAGTGRGVLWKQTIERITQRPIFGFGPDGFYNENAIISHDGYTHDSPHNEFLQMAGFSGIPALVFYLAALITLAVHHWKKMKDLDPMVIACSGVALTYLFSSFFGNPVFNTAPFFFMFLGLMMGTCKTKEYSKRGKPPLLSIILSIVACIAVSGLLYMFTIIRNNEKICEFADLQAMYNAQLTVQAMSKEGELEGTDFWYDADNYILIKDDNTMPATYGMGTKANAYVLEPFNLIYYTKLEYDGTVDYTDKIIKVHVDGFGDNLNVSMEWVQTK